MIRYYGYYSNVSRGKRKRKSRKTPFHASLRKMISHLKSVKAGLG
jgi:hypothetical protein